MNIEVIYSAIKDLVNTCEKTPGRCFENRSIEGFHLMLRRGYGHRKLPWSQIRTNRTIEIVQFGWAKTVFETGDIADVPKGEFSRHLLPVLIAICKQLGYHLYVECVESEKIIESYCSESRGEFRFERMPHGNDIILRISEADAEIAMEPKKY